MHTSECTVMKKVPDPVNLTSAEERKKLDQLGESIASSEHLHFEGYIACTQEPYSVSKAKTTLFFD